MAFFKPIVHACEIVEGDERLDFWVREPSGREILTAATKTKGGKEKSAIENARELFENYVVHEDGTKITEAEADEYIDMRLSAMHAMSNIVQEKIGLKKILEKNV